MSKTTPVQRVQAAFTEGVCRRAVEVSTRTLSEGRARRARHTLLDWLGVTLAGSREPGSKIVRTAAIGEGGKPLATIVGTTDRVGPQAAALANGAAAHALDFDDSNFWMTGHPSAPVTAAVLAVAEQRGLRGEQVVPALVAGHEVGARVGIAVGNRHYLAGWHATGTLGTIAAAAGAGRALELDVDGMQRAIGLAATQAAGLKVSFGTMTKPFHAGRAAAAGVLAALLAQQGFTAPDAALEGHQGFAWTQAPGFDPERVDDELDGRMGIEGVVYKRHACCGGTHGSISALEQIVEMHTPSPAEIDDVEIRVSRQMFDICCIPEPATGTEGKFSIRHVASLVLAGRSTGPSGFTDDAVQDAELVALRSRVRVEASGAETGQETEALVRLRSGELMGAHSKPRLASTDDMLGSEWTQLLAKFNELAVPVIGERSSAELAERVDAIEDEPDIGSFMSLTCGRDAD